MCIFSAFPLLLAGIRLIAVHIAMANVRALPLVLVIVIAAGGNAGIVMMAEAQSAPPAGSSCSSFLVSLAPCLAFMQPGVQNNTTPTQGCCTALASVVNTSAACLCQLLTTTNNSLGIPINQTRSLALPGACKITTPPVSQCKSPAGNYLMIIIFRMFAY